MEEYTSYRYWRDLYAGVPRSLDGPFNHLQPASGEVYLKVQLIDLATLPIETRQAWQRFPGFPALAGWFRFVVLPILFEIRLCGGEWDPGPVELPTVEEVVLLADQSADQPFLHEIPRMRAMTATLDGLLERSSDDGLQQGFTDFLNEHAGWWNDLGPVGFVFSIET